MPTFHNPKSVVPPFSRYSHVAEVPAGARWVHLSGQVGVGPDGQLAEGAAGQIERAFLNVLALLEAAGMGPHDVVKVNVFLTRPEDIPAYREVRDRLLQGAAPASTLLIVSGLARREWVVEVEAVAAKA
jgi:2-iminobutanoate/2-iminopropanoate deaminase